MRIGTGKPATGAIVAVVAGVVVLALVPVLMGALPRGEGRDLSLIPMVVLSGSMEPSIRTGSMLFVERAAAEQVREGDVITYRTPAAERPAQQGADLTTHRVVHVLRSPAGLSFVTRGDANDGPDSSAVPASHVIGKAAFALPYIGYVSAFARTREGMLFLVVLPALLVIALEARSIRNTVRERRDVRPDGAANGQTP